MAKEMKTEIVSREIIKPSSPTPPDLKTYDLSFFDQKAPNVYISILYFYPAIFDKHEKIDNISTTLKTSLSKTLTQFYPFAGRVNDSVTSIECNDEGAIFIEARVSGVMALVLEESDYSIMKQFCLCGNDHTVVEPLVQVQANFFECGGLVISLSMSHKLADASTVNTFIKAWSATSSNSDEADIGFADISLASILPATNDFPSLPLGALRANYSSEDRVAAKRYLFDKSKISLLKERACNEGVKNPTRVECVNGLLWKCLMAASRSRFGVERPSNLFQAVNLRPRTTPQLPVNSIGNAIAVSKKSRDEEETSLNGIIRNIRRGLHETSKIVADGINAEEIYNIMMEAIKELISKEKDSCYISSWCRLIPNYEADFGWGKPIWACPCFKPVKNGFTLIDTRDGFGIEAWCALSEQDIAFLEQDQEFLTFASIK